MSRCRRHRPERDRMVFAVLRLIRGKSHKEAAGKSGVSPQTITKWRTPVASGGTRFPQFYTLDQVLRANGHCLKPVAIDESEPLVKSETLRGARAH